MFTYKIVFNILFFLNMHLGNASYGNEINNMYKIAPREFLNTQRNDTGFHVLMIQMYFLPIICFS